MSLHLSNWLRNLSFLNKNLLENMIIMPANTTALLASIAALTAAVTTLETATSEIAAGGSAAATQIATLTAENATLTADLATPVDSSAVDALTVRVKTAANSLLAISQVPSTISLNLGNPSVAIGSTLQFEATVEDQDGTPLATQPGITWSLQQGAAGTIDQAGLYTAPTIPGSGADQVTATVTGGTVANTTAANYS